MKKIYKNPDIYEIKIPLPGNPLRELNSYLIVSGRESLLIDTGFKHPESLQALRSALEEAGADSETMRIFLTHLHTDHTGSVCDVSDDRTTIYMSEPDYTRYLSSTIPGHWKVSDECFLRKDFRRKD